MLGGAGSFMVLMSSGEPSASGALARDDTDIQSGSGDEVMIATKLFVPTRRRQPIARPRLYVQLGNALKTSLTLVVAPAGWGKTTVIADWLAAVGVRAGWVS